MDILRTPDDCFDNLLDYPFTPNYLEVGEGDGLRLHYVNEGPNDGPVVLLMHGEPSWSYLYRHMIPPLVAAGARVLAPDLIGFGKSDKPAAREDYTYERHVGWMSDWFMKLDLKDVTLFCQDWGGLIGLRLVTAMPDRFAAVVASNTGLPIGKGEPSDAFRRWLDYSQNVPVLPVGQIIQQGTLRKLNEAEIAAYDAPYPDESYKSGARIFPALVPITESHASVEENRAAWAVLAGYKKPFLTAFSDQDPVTRGGDELFRAKVPGAEGRPHREIEDGAHFVQEDQPEALSQVILDALRQAGKLA